MLRLDIDGSWEPQDFIDVLRSIESFYYKLALTKAPWRFRAPYLFDDDYMWEQARYGGLPFEVTLDQINRRLLERARYETPSHRRLKVSRIQYASPGGIDLLGIGKVFETICNSVGRMKSYYDEAHLRKERDEQASLETELKRLQVEKERENLQSLKIKNAKDALQLHSAHPEIVEILLPLLVRDQDALANRISERKLIAAHTTSSDREVG